MEQVGRNPAQRLAVPADLPAIATLMRQSIIELFPNFYDEQQTRSAAAYIAQVDESLINDRTYFVHESGGELVGCGGWSRRDRLYTGSGTGDGDARALDPRTEPARVRAMFVRADRTRQGIGRMILQSCACDAGAAGFTRLSLMATLPGVPLYRSFGFIEVRRTTVTMPDGVGIDAVVMERPVTLQD
jgi:GNAT superfamily N-acetyltransferase